jgi:Tfp pilus assembly protein PilV
MVLIAVLVVALALASALLYLRIERANDTADLQVQSVALQSAPHGAVCMLYATLATNGKPGTVTYRWTSDQNVADPVESVSVGEDQEQLVIGRRWVPDSSGANADPLITIQLLSPTPATAATQPAAGCQR